jgi:hypothetical protein
MPVFSGNAESLASVPTSSSDNLARAGAPAPTAERNSHEADSSGFLHIFISSTVA